MQQQLITLCPECQTRFDISLEQLQAADGRVRCGSCQHIFVASEHIESNPAPSKKSGSAIPREAILLSPRQHRHIWPPLLWSLLILLSLAGIAAQVLWFERDRLSLNADLQPLYRELCQRFDCQLPPRQDLPNIRSQQLLIRQHPDYSNALSLDLTLINLAPFDQPFPALQLSFTSLNNNLRAARTFQPSEYLAGDLKPDDRMPQRSPVQVHLELLDPGTLAPNYQLLFVRARPGNLDNK